LLEFIEAATLKFYKSAQWLSKSLCVSKAAEDGLVELAHG